MKFLLLSMMMWMVLLSAEGGSSWRGKEEGTEIMNTIHEGFSSLLNMVNGYPLKDVASAFAFAFAGIYGEPANDVDNDDACRNPAVSHRNITVRLFLSFFFVTKPLPYLC